LDAVLLCLEKDKLNMFYMRKDLNKNIALLLLRHLRGQLTRVITAPMLCCHLHSPSPMQLVLLSLNADTYFTITQSLQG